MYAIIKHSGRQFQVTPGQTIAVNRFSHDGPKVTFDDVLLVRTDDQTIIGAPVVTGAKVQGTVVFDGLAKKVIVQKFKSKVRYRRKKGHRQVIARVRIDAIDLP